MKRNLLVNKSSIYANAFNLHFWVSSSDGVLGL